jgi:hypothetical protein
MSNSNAQGSASGPPADSNSSYIRHSSWASVAAGTPQGNQRNPRLSTGTQSEEISAAGQGVDSDAGPPPWIRPSGFGSSARELDDYFIPSYLQHSRYAQQLEREHKARLAEMSRARSASNPPTAPRGPSTAGNTGSGSRLAAHRGITADVVERPPKMSDDTPPPLPSKWNMMDRNNTSVDIYNNGLDAKFTGPPRGHDDAAVVRADHPMPKVGGIYYFEIQVLSKGREGRLVSFGFCTQKVTLNRLPGWEPESWAYHSDDGQIFNASQHGRTYGQKYGPQDTVGCGVNFRTGTAFFTKNGNNIGT